MLVPVVLLRGREHMRQAHLEVRLVRDLILIVTMTRPQLTALDPTIEERLTLESFEVIMALESAVLRKLSRVA